MGIVANCETGEIYEVPDVLPSIEQAWALVRAERNAKLAACDWTQLPDAPVDHAAWATYRQALRDVTNQSDPFNIQWPVAPAE